MPIEYVTGDLFANRFQAAAFAHGCNCLGSMGAGIATGFKGRYPEMYAEYHRRCKSNPREFNLGDVFFWNSTDGRPGVFNLGTQEGIWRARASYEAIGQALQKMRELADQKGLLRIAIPRIGAGYGGLSWKKIRILMEETFRDWAGTLFIYENYAPEESPENLNTMIIVESHRRKLATVEKCWPGALIVDVTSKGPEPWVRFSPFYPHGGIPVPHSPGVLAESVEGLWQGLKTFEKEDIDPSRWKIKNLSGIKRTGTSRGKVLGHRLGVGSEQLLNYREARYQIYLPAYRWVLENCLTAELAQLQSDRAGRNLVLLDYETNCSVEDLTSPLSHAGLIKAWLQNEWPTAPE